MNNSQMRDYERLLFDELLDNLTSEYTRQKALAAELKDEPKAAFSYGVACGLSQALTSITDLRKKLEV